jgi:hypothetical protein
MCSSLVWLQPPPWNYFAIFLFPVLPEFSPLLLEAMLSLTLLETSLSNQDALEVAPVRIRREGAEV